MHLALNCRSQDHGANAALKWTKPNAIIAFFAFSLILIGDAAQSAAQPISEPAQTRIDELTSHIEGMEDKLRDSASARKAADQARMEAERRLAESLQVRDLLQEDLLRLEQARDALLRALSGQVETVQALESQLRQQQDLARAFDALRAHMPQSVGGLVTPDQARASAARAFVAFKQARTRSGRGPDAEMALIRAENDLNRQQLLVADAIGATTLYRVGVGDTLAGVAARLYGAGARWRDIFAANRHLLDDPDRLTPGMMLVVP